MSSNMWGAIIDEADSPAPAQKTSKKKNRKKNKKSSASGASSTAASSSSKPAVASDELSNPGSAIDAVVAQVSRAGFKAKAVKDAIGRMFDAGLAYDDPEAVVTFMRGGKKEPAAVTKAPVKAPVKAPAPATAPAATPAPARTASVPSSSSSAQDSSPAPAASSAVEANPVDAEEQLAARFVQVAGLANLGDVCRALVSWALKAPAQEMTVFFSSEAPYTLFQNILSSGPAPDMDAKLRGVMEGLLAGAQQSLDTLAPSIKAGASSLITTVRALLTTFGEIREEAMSSYKSEWEDSVDAASSRLATSLRSFRKALSTRAIAQEQASSVSRQLETARAALRALPASSEPADARIMFRSRDVLCQVCKNLQTQVQCATGFESADSSPAGGAGASSAEGVSDADLTTTLDGLAGPVDEGTKKKREVVMAELKKMRDEKERAITPIITEATEIDAKVSSLRSRKEELLREVATINADLKVCGERKIHLQKAAVDVDQQFRTKLEGLDRKNRGLASAVRRSEAGPKVLSALSTLRDDLSAAKNMTSTAASSSSESLLAIQSARAQFAETVVSYFYAQGRCIEFLRSRVGATKARLSKLESEVEQYKQLGMDHVAQNCAVMSQKLRENITEDTSLVNQLCGEAMGMVNAIRGDASVATTPLHPAELAMQHRVRSLAYQLCVLHPAGTAPTAVNNVAPAPAGDLDALWSLPAEPASDDPGLSAAALASLSITGISLAPVKPAAFALDRSVPVPVPTATAPVPAPVVAGSGSTGSVSAAQENPSSGASGASGTAPSVAVRKPVARPAPVAPSAGATAVSSSKPKFSWASMGGSSSKAAPSLTDIMASEASATDNGVEESKSS